MELYIVRHGDRADAHEDYTGGPNPPLSDTGRWQALRVAERLGEVALTHLYASPARRALETALPTQYRTRLPLAVWPAFAETGPGHWRSGRARAWDPAEPLAVDEESAATLDEDLPYFQLLADLPRRYPGIRLSQPFPWPDAWWLPVHREAREAAYHRAGLALDALKARHLKAGEGEADEDGAGNDVRAAVFCHTNIANVLVTLLTAARPSSYGRFRFATASISCVLLHPERPPRVLYLNDCGHLET